VVVFVNHKGDYQYVTTKTVSDNVVVSTSGVTVKKGAQGTTLIQVQSPEKGAYIVYFN